MTLPTAAPQTLLPFQDPSRSEAERVADLLSRLTREEKIVCFSTVPDVPRLGVVGTGHVEGLHGLALGEPGDWAQGAPRPSTQFPQSYGLGQTWDRELMRKVGEAEGKEVRHYWESEQLGGLVVRAPNADLGRDPRWGRTEECYGEDPFLVGHMAAAMSKGLSGPDPKRLLTASLLKHFLSNSNEVGRENGSSDYDARLYHEYYAEPFRRAVQEGGAQGLMAAYNGYNGIPCAVHPMLRAVLRQQWGHDGIICTDGGAYTMLVTKHRLFHTKDEAAAACIKAGINQFLDDHPRGTRGALHKGLLNDADLDDALGGVFRVMLRLGQLDAPADIAARKLPASTPNPCHSAEHQALALEAVIKSAVLLKNNGLLPLAPASLKKVAVIGPHADEVIADWYGGDPPLRVSPLQGLRERLKGAEVLGHNGKDRAAAAKLAASCDAAIVLVGNHPLGHGGWDKVDSVLEAKECIDRQDIALRDEDLYQAVLKAQAKAVLVIVSSFPVACNESAKNAPAILHLTHSGQAQGTGLAALLCGDANPGGKLSQTWPTGIEQLPPMRDYDLRAGRTYLYSKHKPLYAFGHGLSYTKFELGAAKLSAPALKAGGTLSLSVELSNTGAHDGDEVLQVYVRWTGSKIDRPIRALKAFQRVSVPKGQKRTAELVLHADDLRHWDEAKNAWALEAGSVELELGTGSDAISQRLKLEVQA